MTSPLESDIQGMGIPGPIAYKIRQAASWAAHISSAALPKHFISEYREPSGQVIVQSVVFYSDELWVEIEGLINPQPQVDVLRITNNVGIIQMVPTDYDLAKAAANSRLQVKFSLLSAAIMWPGGWLLLASGANCDRLVNLVRDTLRPNLDAG